MIQKIFVVFDDKAKAYLPPFYLHNTEMAKRVFGNCINSDTHQFGQNPSDYTLFMIGEFDDNSGMIETHEPTSLGNGIEHYTPG